ncbi:MAG: alpha/beta hydrolase [Hamadaea sp.]|nr:alpha/beta hydrolase [Hamadaea sp.]NUT08684.1 alpha/beta hydrolase [Hamadaea sp.]
MERRIHTEDEHGIAPDGLGLDDDYAGERDLPVQQVRSADGTLIAYEKSGRGEPVVVLGGGLNDRGMFYPFANLMSENFTVYNCDRRGRGDSGMGDLDGYVIEREVEDLAAVVEAVEKDTGQTPYVFANCTGGQIVILAAAAGVPMKKLGLYEPPYWSRPATTEQIEEIRRLNEAGDHDGAVALFGRDVVGFVTDETIDGFRQHPAWQAFLANAPSTYYDAIISRDHTQIPHEALAKISAPTLIIRGELTVRGIFDAMEKVVDELADAKLVTMEEVGHLYDQKRVAPIMTEFFQS